MNRSRLHLDEKASQQPGCRIY